MLRRCWSSTGLLKMADDQSGSTWDIFWGPLPIDANRWTIFVLLSIDHRLTDTNRYQLTNFIDWFGLIDWFSGHWVPSIGYPGYWKPSLLSFWEFCLVQLSLPAFVLSVILVPMDLDVTTKAVVLGSCFLIVSSHSHNTILSKVYCKQEPWSKQDIGSEPKEPERKFALSPWKLCPRLKPPRARGTFGSGDENVAGNTVLETDTKGCKIYWMLSIPQPSSTRGVQKILNSSWLFLIIWLLLTFMSFISLQDFMFFEQAQGHDDHN